MVVIFVSVDGAVLVVCDGVIVVVCDGVVLRPMIIMGAAVVGVDVVDGLDVVDGVDGVADIACFVVRMTGDVRTCEVLSSNIDGEDWGLTLDVEELFKPLFVIVEFVTRVVFDKDDSSSVLFIEPLPTGADVTGKRVDDVPVLLDGAF